ncbi:MAG: hypothetical protein IIA91_05020 [Chloroflexi bacterium]|nr:hypothetical protein [Chloroflexota bacterium]
MDSKLRKILTECIRHIETGARDVEGCLQLHPDRAAELRPHLELWSGLNASAKAQPNFGSQQRGRHQLLGALSDMERGKDKRKMIPALARVVVVMAAAALLVGGAAGGSAALGGPDVTHDVLAGIGLSNASDTGKQHANPNALDGAHNAYQGSDNASQTGQNNANPKASEGASNADDAPKAPGSVPDGAQVPDSVPVGPQP